MKRQLFNNSKNNSVNYRNIITSNNSCVNLKGNGIGNSINNLSMKSITLSRKSSMNSFCEYSFKVSIWFYFLNLLIVFPNEE